MEFLAFVGFITIGYLIYKFIEGEVEQKKFHQKRREIGRRIARNFSSNDWSPSTNPILHTEIYQFKLTSPESFQFDLDLPNERGFIYLRYNSHEKWELQHVPRGHAMNYPFGIPLSKNSLGFAFKIGDKFYKALERDKSITTEEFINRL